MSGEEKKVSVGFIGQGIMGVPMAKNLLTAGFEVPHSTRFCGTNPSTLERNHARVRLRVEAVTSVGTACVGGLNF